MENGLSWIQYTVLVSLGFYWCLGVLDLDFLNIAQRFKLIYKKRDHYDN